MWWIDIQPRTNGRRIMPEFEDYYCEHHLNVVCNCCGYEGDYLFKPLQLVNRSFSCIECGQIYTLTKHDGEWKATARRRNR